MAENKFEGVGVPSRENIQEQGVGEGILEDIVFEEVKDKKGKVVKYRSSVAGRKSIEINASEISSKNPEPGKPYRVKILEDTDPQNPEKGKFIAELFHKPGEDVSEEEWREIETRVREAEKFQRAAKKSSKELYGETGLVKEGRKDGETSEILSGAKRRRVAEKALTRESVFETEAESILGGDDSLERALVGFQKENLLGALKEEAKISKEKEKLLVEEVEVLSGIELEPTGSELEALNDIRKDLDGVQKKREKLLASNPEAYYGLHLKELKNFESDLEKRKEGKNGRIVETAYVREKSEDIAVHLRANKPVMIYGHLGTGKTEVAMHVAREYLGKEALVISGSKNISLAEFYGHQILTIDTIKKGMTDEYAREVGEKYQKWVEENQEFLKNLPEGEKENEKNRAHDRILQTYLTQFKGGTISDFFLGPIYRAMEEGRPVIIDEVNAIPHEILISLNHILTRKVGEEVNVQQDSGRTIKIKDGFGIIMTGNLPQGEQDIDRYVGRQPLDAAFLSRLHKIEYDYLPQKTEGTLENEAGSENELFHIMLADVMDKNGNIEAPGDAIRKLWNLAKAGRIIQDVFAGREVGNAYYFQEGGGRAIPYFLKESVLSMRALDNILSQWQREGYRQELDYYIWTEFIAQSTVVSDRAYLYQMLKDRFGFFQSAGWEKNPSYGIAGNIQSFDIKTPKNPGGEIKFFGPRDTVEFAFGKGPARTRWPEVKRTAKKRESVSEKTELAQRLEEERDLLFADLGSFEKEVREECGK